MANYKVTNVKAFNEMKAYFKGEGSNNSIEQTINDLRVEDENLWGKKHNGGDLVEMVKFYNAECNRSGRAIPLPCYKSCACGRDYINYKAPPFNDTVCGSCKKEPCACHDYCVACGDVVCSRGEDDFEDDCAYLRCLDCNSTPTEYLTYKPCRFDCNSHMYSTYHNNVYTDSQGVVHWNSGVVCKKCYTEKLYEDERSAAYRKCSQLFKDRDDVALVGTLTWSCSVHQWRRLAYMCDDKIKYFLDYKSWGEKWRRGTMTYLSQMLLISPGYFSKRTFPAALSRYFYSSLNDMGPTPATRPWKKIKVLARLVIIFRRYKEDYYRPDKGGYVGEGAARFDRAVIKRRKL